MANEADVFLDDTRLQDRGWRFRLSSEEPGLPELRNRTVTVPGRHGHYDFGAYFGAREFMLDAVSNGEFANYNLSAKLNGVVTKETITEIPEGAQDVNP